MYLKLVGMGLFLIQSEHLHHFALEAFSTDSGLEHRVCVGGGGGSGGGFESA